MSLPLVTCMMPTYGRPDYVAESIAMFLAQDYPAKELIILNDCPGQTLVGDFPNVRIINSPERYPSLGEKRNAIIEQAAGELIAVWDDDDIYLPWRLSFSVQELQKLQTPLYIPLDLWAYCGERFLLDNRVGGGRVSHPAFLFRRDAFQLAGGYPPQTMCEDAVFVERLKSTFPTLPPPQELARLDRFVVLRITSEYHHTSLEGGRRPADTTPGEFRLEPREIEHAELRTVVTELIRQKRQADDFRRTAAAAASQSPLDAAASHVVWLDELTPTSSEVGYGGLGRRGHLGYEEKWVEVCGLTFGHALSAHGPSRLTYRLDGRYREFTVRVAFNDDVPVDASAADFIVHVDDRISGIVERVRPHQLPRELRVDVRSARELTLEISAGSAAYCHTVWLDPRLMGDEQGSQGASVIDCLDRATITIPSDLPDAPLCIATVGSPGFEDWIDDLLASLCANGQCVDAQLAIFFFGDSPQIERIAAKYHAVVVRCTPRRPIGISSKAVLYSAAQVIRASKFLCLDADMLVLDDLRPIVAALDALPSTAVLCCREAMHFPDLKSAFYNIYYAQPDTLIEALGAETADGLDSRFVVNDGLFAGTAAALQAIDQRIRGMSRAADWVDDPAANCPWRNQFVFNLALAQGECGVELDGKFNVQLMYQAAERRANVPGTAWWQGRRAGVVHFNSSSKSQRPAWQMAFRTPGRVLAGPGGGDAYSEFVVTLRRWIGRYSLDALAWSFYGTTDGSRGEVADLSVFPLLATLHYVLRANGCERILETGTVRGISTACLASAVAHRANPLVVTLDPSVSPEREELWASLPERSRNCIEPRREASLAGMQRALEQGETFHAALLDTIHSAEHVLQEFELARQLVCRGGLILIHDPVYAGGSVGSALKTIAEQGYGVVQLWTAEEGVREDDHLGLALIENRRR